MGYLLSPFSKALWRMLPRFVFIQFTWYGSFCAFVFYFDFEDISHPVIDKPVRWPAISAVTENSDNPLGKWGKVTAFFLYFFFYMKGGILDPYFRIKLHGLSSLMKARSLWFTCAKDLMCCAANINIRGKGCACCDLSHDVGITYIIKWSCSSRHPHILEPVLSQDHQVRSCKLR